MVTKEQIATWLENYARRIEENKVYLTKLDAAIGDADHGINMSRGFRAVMEKLPSVKDKDIGTILKTTGMSLVSTVGGAGGPLYGTLFMQAGMAVDKQEELSDKDLVKLFEAALQGVMQRGRSQPGQKTMIDAIRPGLDALQEAVEEGAGTAEAMKRATDAAFQGMKDTIPMIAQKGRASYLGERSRGHQDPGATSSFMLFQALYDVLTPEQVNWVLEEAREVSVEDLEEIEPAVGNGD